MGDLQKNCNTLWPFINSKSVVTVMIFFFSRHRLKHSLYHKNQSILTFDEQFSKIFQVFYSDTYVGKKQATRKCYAHLATHEYIKKIPWSVHRMLFYQSSFS